MSRGKTRPTWTIALVGLVAVASAAAWFVFGLSDAESETVSYETATVEEGTLSVMVSGSGYVELSDRVEVWPEGAAVVDTIEVAEGSVVETDAVLLTLDDEDYGVDDEVLAPESGVVWMISVAEGDDVQAASAAVAGAQEDPEAPIVIAPADPLTVRVDVNEVDVPALEAGQKAEVTFDALPDLTITGSVTEIDREGTNTQGVVTYGVWIALDVQDEQLKPGMSASATIVTAVVSDELLVPNAALETDGDGLEYVEVLDTGAENPRAVYVETGLFNATTTVVTSGLVAGDAVVVSTVTNSGEEEEESSGGFMLPGMGGGRPGGGD